MNILLLVLSIIGTGNSQQTQAFSKVSDHVTLITSCEFRFSLLLNLFAHLFHAVVLVCYRSCLVQISKEKQSKGASERGIILW